MASKSIKAANTNEKAYADFRDQVFNTVREFNRNALVGSWDIGELYSSFVGDSESYGKSVVKRLAEEMFAAGMAGSVETAKSTIYVSAQINRTFSRAQLVELSGYNLTPGHAKVLAAIPADLMGAVLAGSFVERDDGQRTIVSISRLREIIYEKARALGIDIGRSAPVIERFVSDDVGAPALDEDEDDYTIPATPPTVPSTTAADVTPATSAAVGGDVAPEVGDFAGAEEPQGTHRDSAPAPDGVKNIVSPLKVLKDFEKLVTRVNVMCSDVFLAVEQQDKEGSDSEVAYENFRKAFEEARSVAKGLTGPLAKLIERLSRYDFNKPG